MKKMRKFAWIFMAAMTVAGFSACSNVEDELLPGTGGNGGDGTTPSKVLTDTIYTFDNIEANYTPIDELCPGWTHEIVSPADDDRTWQSKVFKRRNTFRPPLTMVVIKMLVSRMICGCLPRR